MRQTRSRSMIVLAMDAVMFLTSIAFGYIGGIVAAHLGFNQLLGMLGAAYLPYFANLAIKRAIFVDPVKPKGKGFTGIDEQGLDCSLTVRSDAASTVSGDSLLRLSKRVPCEVPDFVCGSARA